MEHKQVTGVFSRVLGACILGSLPQATMNTPIPAISAQPIPFLCRYSVGVMPTAFQNSAVK